MVDRTENQLARAIREGEWAVGAQLPPLRALAGKLGVSVNTAQAALRRLEDRHIVDVRPRRGAYVKAAPREGTRVANQIAVVRRITTPLQAGVTGTAGTDGWGLRIVQAMEAGLHKAGLDLTNTVYPEDDPAPLGDVLRRLDNLGSSLAAVVCFVSERLAGLLPALDERDVPWLTINALDRLTVHNFVSADNVGGGRRVGRCFGLMGLRRVLLLHSGYDHTPTNLDKLEGVFLGMLECGAPTDGVRVESCCREMTFQESARLITKAVLAREEQPPQAIFATGDTMAAGAMDACREGGLRVPDDVGVIGATGLAMAEHTGPPLTTLAQPMDAMGQQAAEMLVRMARERSPRLVGRFVPSPIRFRESLNVSDPVRRDLEQAYAHEVEAAAIRCGSRWDARQPASVC